MLQFPYNLIVGMVGFFVVLGIAYLFTGEWYPFELLGSLFMSWFAHFIYLNLFQQHEVEERIAAEADARGEIMRQRRVAYFRRLRRRITRGLGL